MFYSHQILARKGPLATVWIAAHLQHKLKKSHYTSTDISSTVDRIMFPEAPIALRMSGHLLLGVVRIYSKKVDYLHHDCNVILIGISRAFSSKDINLPENVSIAPSDFVTLPDTFELDALNLDDDFIIHDGDQDRFLRTHEEITLADQIPVGTDYYVAITFDEDILINQSRQEEVPHSGRRVLEQDGSILPQIQLDVIQSNQAEIYSERLYGGSDSVVRPMEEDIIPPLPVDTNVGFHDPGPSNQMGIVNEQNSPQNVAERELMMDPVHDFQIENSSVLPNLHSDITQPQRPADLVTNEKEILSPSLEEIIFSGGQSSLLKKHSEGPISATSAEVPDTRFSFGASPELAIRSTPPVEQPKPRARKRKRLIDKTIGLTNEFIKKALEDCHDLSRKRKPRPASLLGDWKLRRKEQIFDDPSIYAIFPDLCDIFKKDFIIAKPHLVVLEEAFSEPRVSRSPTSAADFNIEIEHVTTAQTPVPIPGLDSETGRLGVAQSPAPVPDLGMEIDRLKVAQFPAVVADLDMEIEHFVQYKGNAGSNVLSGFMLSPSGFMGSPVKTNDFTPVSANNLGSDFQGGTTIGTGVMSTPSMIASTVPFGSEMGSPKSFLEQTGVDSTGLFDIPEFMNSAEVEDLNFLEADNTPTSSQGTQNVDGLSVRTRAVAQFLNRHSPGTQISENPTDDLSLNKILEGKSRKLCARMFFETLVLKSYGLVDVHQEEPYGDINLKLTSTLKARF